MHSEANINLGRALAEVIFGLLIAIALHLGLPQAAVARLRARMELTAEEWETLYSAWLAARLASVPPKSIHRRRTIARPESVRRAARRRSVRRVRPVRAVAAPVARAVPSRGCLRPEGGAACPVPVPRAGGYVPAGQPRKFRAWPAG